MKTTHSKIPDISIIVPVYNTEKYLKKCLNSLLNQTLKNIEIIVVDDGSTDSSSKIIDSYAKKSPKIKAIHKKNGGVGSAYNTGLKVAKGRYIGSIDSDDWVDPDMFKTLYDIAQKYHTDVVKSNSFWSHKTPHKKKKIIIPEIRCNQVIKNNLAIPEFVYGHISHWAGIYKHSFLKKTHISFYDKERNIAPDVDFIFRVWLKAKSFYIVSQPFVHYRTNRPTSDKFSGAKMSFSLLHTHRLVRDYFKAERADKTYWEIKVLAEFYHLKFELQQRCNTRRSEFIKELSSLLWDNISDGYVREAYYPKRDLLLYYTLGCLPFLYAFNDKLRFWIRRPGPHGLVINWYLCGLFRYITHSKLSLKPSSNHYYSICGLTFPQIKN